MIHWVNIVDAQYNDTHAQLGQSSHEWGSPRCKYYGSVKHSDAAALISYYSRSTLKK